MVRAMPVQQTQCDMYDQRSSAMWRQRIALELKHNEVKRPISTDDIRSAISEPAQSRLSTPRSSTMRSELSTMQPSNMSFTSSVVARIDDLHRQLEEERKRRQELENELQQRLERKIDRDFARVIPKEVSPSDQMPTSHKLIK